MNDAHLHLLVNHVPLIGIAFGFGILLAGMLMKNEEIKKVAYVLYIISTVFGALSMATGEGAEEAVEHLPGVTHSLIHEHEEHAEKLMVLMYAMGILSILSFYFSIKKISFHKITSFLILGVSLFAGYLAYEVGATGGVIRHSEIRTQEVTDQPIQSEENESEHDED